MIKVIFIDCKDGEHDVVSEQREKLKHDYLCRKKFEEYIHIIISHYMEKIQKEIEGVYG